MSHQPGRRTVEDARVQAMSHGRMSSLCHASNSAPLGPDNLVYLYELRAQAIAWVSSIDTEIAKIEQRRTQLLKTGEVTP